MNIKTPPDMTIGTIHKTNASGDLKIVKYNSRENVDVEFLSTGYKLSTRSSSIRSSQVKDPLHPSVYGVGFIGVGKYSASKGRCSTMVYKRWSGMLKRCYSDKCQSKHTTYTGCTVNPEWLNFQNFAAWYEKSYIDGWHLDKDLIIVGNKIYSPDNCILIPQWLNCFTTDSKAKRGEWPIGVSFSDRYRNFMSSCSDDGTKKTIGRFSTPEAAHLAWRKFKLSLALNRKHEMDAIDIRIYPNVVKIIEDAR